MWQELLQLILNGDVKALSRCISLIESEAEGYQILLQSLPFQNTARTIGITGAPGTGKSTLTDALIGALVIDEKKIGVLCVDPSSPFNLGALLGDRIRMSDWYNHPNVFIRSLATRGALGGLHPKTIEITDLMKAAGFDYIIIETVGVGQSEIEIAGLAETTIVVLIPDSGDEIQTMKSGLMEIADIFVVNKSDRPGADTLIKNLSAMTTPTLNHKIPILKTIASQKKGITELKTEILQHTSSANIEKKYWLMAEKAFQLLQKERMKDIDKNMLREKIMKDGLTNFNLYQFVNSLSGNNIIL
jgi:LAO/AO transport system kinase